MTLHPEPVVAAVDWGTSSFRLWLLDGRGSVVAETRSQEGLSEARQAGFEAILDKHLDRLGAAKSLPVVICGMAGSRQGWAEAPYLPCPASLGEIAQSPASFPAGDRRVHILPGIAQRDGENPDVMRGEETQLLGLDDAMVGARHLVCLPGTHCKWADVEDGMVRRFATWPTGEMFAVMSSASILRHAIGSNGGNVSPSNPAFLQWAAIGFSDPGATVRRLFSIRAATLLARLETGDAANALSGLLIGSEIGSALKWAGTTVSPVLLVAAGRLGELYGAVLADRRCRHTLADADLAVRAGLFRAFLAITGHAESKVTA